MPRAVREIRIEGAIAYVPLSRGYEALIDASDVPLVSGRNWSVLISRRRKAIYACRVEVIDGASKMILMHRLLSNAEDGELVDHRDGNGLNNRRANFRHCTRAENALNTGVRSDNKSGFKGVFFDARSGKWRSEISRDGRSKYLGLFADPASAHAAYVAAASDLHGEFARTA